MTTLIALAEAEAGGLSVYTILWLLWGLMFAVVEGAAIIDKRSGDTLSEHVWKWFAVRVSAGSTPKARGLRRLALLSFMAWLSTHFLTGGWV